MPQEVLGICLDFLLPCLSVAGHHWRQETGMNGLWSDAAEPSFPVRGCIRIFAGDQHQVAKPINSKCLLCLAIGIILLFSIFCNFSSFSNLRS